MRRAARGSRPVGAMIASLLAVLLLAAGCGRQAELRRESPPTEYTGMPLSIVEVAQGERGPDPYTAVLSGTLSADDGTEATLTLEQFVDLQEGGSVECGGETSKVPFTLEDTEERAGTLEISGWGSADLTIERTVGSFPSPLGPPICVESVGTWTGTDGRLDGRSGSWTALFAEGIQGLTLEERAGS